MADINTLEIPYELAKLDSKNAIILRLFLKNGQFQGRTYGRPECSIVFAVPSHVLGVAPWVAQF